MKLFKKLAAGFLLLIGLPIIAMGTYEAINPKIPAKDKEGAIAALIFFGLPPTAIGGWLIWSLKQQHDQELKASDHALEQQFLDVLQANNGSITPLRLAAAANVPIDQAKLFLDQKAKQLDATFEVSDQGSIIYRFPF